MLAKRQRLLTAHTSAVRVIQVQTNRNTNTSIVTYKGSLFRGQQCVMTYEIMNTLNHFSLQNLYFEHA